METISFTTLHGIPVRYYLPPGAGPHPVFLLLHGWSGDEDSMWVFASRLPAQAVMIAPRGLFLNPGGGYGWNPNLLLRGWPALEDFEEAVSRVMELLEGDWLPQADFGQVKAVGFSQGAALAYSLALLRPGRLQALAGLSGFVPEGAEEAAAAQPLRDVPVFTAHGTQDDIVPIARARAGNTVLQNAGARLVYCEADVGHKLGAACFRGLQEFFR